MIGFLIVIGAPFVILRFWLYGFPRFPKVHKPKFSLEWIGRLDRKDLSTGGLVFGLHLLAILASPIANDLFYILPVSGTLHLIFLWFLRNRADKEALKSARIKIKPNFNDKLR